MKYKKKEMESVKDEIWGRVRGWVWRQSVDQLHHRVWSEVFDHVDDPINEKVQDQVRNRVLDQVQDQMYDRVMNQDHYQVDDLWEQTNEKR